MENKYEDLSEEELNLEIGELIKKLQRAFGEELVKVEDVKGFGGKVYSEDYTIEIDGEETLYCPYYNQVSQDDLIDDKEELIKILNSLKKVEGTISDRMKQDSKTLEKISEVLVEVDKDKLPDKEAIDKLMKIISDNINQKVKEAVRGNK